MTKVTSSKERVNMLCFVIEVIVFKIIFMIFACTSLLTLCIRETPKRVFLQAVKTQMKCSIMLHFNRVYTVYKGRKDLQT